MGKNLKIHNLSKIHLSLMPRSSDVHLNIWKQNLEAEWHSKWIVQLSGLLMLIETLREWNRKCHANLRNFEFCPKGPSEEKDGGECFAPQVYIFFCAAARRQPQKVRQRMQERAQMAKYLKFHNLAKQHLSISWDCLDGNARIWHHNFEAYLTYENAFWHCINLSC